MKIAVMTFWWSNDNYGQLLQAWALQRFLEKRGHDPFLVRYTYLGDVRHPVASYLRLLNPVLAARKLKERAERARASTAEIVAARDFDRFRAERLRFSGKTYRTFAELARDPPDADAYVVGSDQVWNVDGLPAASAPAFFLAFGDAGVRRLSYAASFGPRAVGPEELPAAVPRWLRDFAYVSVREAAGLATCRACGIAEPALDPDPTLLLAADEYRALREGPATPPERPYCFAYLLKNENLGRVAGLAAWAKARGLDFALATGNSMPGGPAAVHPTIPRWLSYVDDAACVVTDSFHGCVFSALLHTKALVLAGAEGTAAGGDGRFSALFRLIGRDLSMKASYDEALADADWPELDRRLAAVANAEAFLAALGRGA